MLRRTWNEMVLAGWEERPREMAAVAVFGSVVTVTHFTSMALFLYTRIWWWDIFVHAASGFGSPGKFSSPQITALTHSASLRNSCRYWYSPPA